MASMSLRYAHLGMMLWVWSALFPPNEYLFGFAQGVPFNKISFVCTLMALMFDKRRNINIDPLLAWLLVFLAEVSLSYVTAATRPEWGGDLYQRLLKVAVAAVFVRFTVVDRARMHAVLIAICLAVGAGAIDEGAKFVLSGGKHHVAGPTSWGDENSTAAIILMVMPIILYLYKLASNKIFKNGCGLVFLGCIVAVIGTYSRGGFIGLIIFYFIFMSSSKNKFISILILMVVFFVGASLVPESWFDRIHSTANAGSDASFMGRVVQWKVLTLMAFDHPLLGAGPIANMDPLIWGPYAARLASELTFISTPPPDYPHASHSIYFQVLGEYGFTGLIIYLALYSMALRMAGDIVKEAKKAGMQLWPADIATAIRGSLILYLITGAALPIVYLEFPYLLIGCISALRAIQLYERKSISRRFGGEVVAVSLPGRP